MLKEDKEDEDGEEDGGEEDEEDDEEDGGEEDEGEGEEEGEEKSWGTRIIQTADGLSRILWNSPHEEGLGPSLSSLFSFPLPSSLVLSLPSLFDVFNLSSFPPPSLFTSRRSPSLLFPLLSSYLFSSNIGDFLEETLGPCSSVMHAPLLGLHIYQFPPTETRKECTLATLSHLPLHIPLHSLTLSLLSTPPFPHLCRTGTQTSLCRGLRDNGLKWMGNESAGHGQQ